MQQQQYGQQYPPQGTQMVGYQQQPYPQQGGYPPQQGGYPPQQGGYPPQQGGYPPQQGMPPMNMYPQGQPYPQQQVLIVEIKNGLQKLASSPGIYIKQKFEVLEAITGCETPNVYKVYPADINGQKTGSKTIFKCKEKSNCCVRQCLPGDCRPFNMKVSNEEGKISGSSLDKTLFLQLERPFKCTCLCLARPEMSVSFVENGSNTFFGKIKNPCLICTLGCHVEDSRGNLKYIITGSCCQLGYLCMGCPFKSCQEYMFEVKNPNGDIITRLQKQSAGCLKACCGDADNFALGFPPDSSPEDKALLMSAALFLDYMYFENKDENKQGGADID